jgi:hypothetical protein
VPCVFCGGSPVTNEHVFPRWPNRYLPSAGQQKLEKTRYGDGGFDIDGPAKGRMSGPFERADARIRTAAPFHYER